MSMPIHQRGQAFHAMPELHGPPVSGALPDFRHCHQPFQKGMVIGYVGWAWLAWIDVLPGLRDSGVIGDRARAVIDIELILIVNWVKCVNYTKYISGATISLRNKDKWFDQTINIIVVPQGRFPRSTQYGTTVTYGPPNNYSLYIWLIGKAIEGANADVFVLAHGVGHALFNRTFGCFPPHVENDPPNLMSQRVPLRDPTLTDTQCALAWGSRLLNRI
jgi:hypothetical protein